MNPNNSSKLPRKEPIVQYIGTFSRRGNFGENDAWKVSSFFFAMSRTLNEDRRIAMRFQGGRDLAKMKPTWEIPDILYYGTDKVFWSRSQISTIFKPWRWDYIGDYMGITLFVHASTSVHLNISYLLHPSLNTNNSYQSCPGTYSIVAQARSCGQGQRNQIFSNPGEGVYKAENFVFFFTSLFSALFLFTPFCIENTLRCA